MSASRPQPSQLLVSGRMDARCAGRDTREVWNRLTPERCLGLDIGALGPGAGQAASPMLVSPEILVWETWKDAPWGDEQRRSEGTTSASSRAQQERP